MKLNKLGALLACAGCMTPAISWATNGMDMEGYGPVATAMGGASMAYDNGTAAMMNNPATLALMAKGSRLDLALGFMGPRINTNMSGMEAPSLANSFYMPAFGWVQKVDSWTYGFGVYGQGGMGTEYKDNSYMSAGTGLPARSELGVGRVLFPLAIEVSPAFSVGGTLDIVWAQLDMQMPMEATQIAAMQSLGLVDMSGSANMNAALGGLQAMGGTAYIDFSDNGRFTGKAKAAGYAGKIGFTYKMTPRLTVGATYHSKTKLADMVAHDASMSMTVGTNPTQVMRGSMTVKNFQWPQTVAFGLSYQPTKNLQLAADYKRIGWKNVMKEFQMTFDAVGGDYLNITFNQNWVDQDVLMMGLGYKVTRALTLRTGINLANNPVPDYYMHALFPAIEKNHAAAGFGYSFSKRATLDFSLTRAFRISATNAMAQMVTHSQASAQMIYSYRF